MTNFLDSVTAGKPRRTQDGYLVADVRAARSGIQLYAGHEVGRPDLDVVRVYRPEEEVFHRDSLASYAYKPSVNGHPPVSVDASNWKDYSTGQMGGDVIRDGDHVRVPLILMDAKAITDYEEGRRQELSMGYSAKIVFDAGKTPQGEDYDAVQKEIRINHISQEKSGRAGTARIGDSWGAAPINDFHQPGIPPKTEKGGRMSDQLKTIVLGDAAVQVAATDVAAVERYKAASDKVFADAEAKHQTEIAAKDADLAKLQARLDDAEGKILSDADIDKRVADRAGLVASAKSIVADLKVDGVADADIRKAVVAAKLGDAAIEGKPEAYIDARFDILVEDADKENPVRMVIQAGDNVANIDDSRNAYLDRLTRRNKQEA